MSDQASFANFASSGAFTGDPALSIPQNVENIGNALTLFILTKALNGNKYIGQLIQTSDIAAGAESSLCTYKGQDVCWHNSTIFGGVVGVLEKTDANDGNHGLSMQQTVIQNGWATAETLYLSGWDCAVSGKFGQTVVDIGGDGTLNFDCLNQMTECYSGTPNGCSDFNGGVCPVGKCTDTQNSHGISVVAQLVEY